MEGDFSTGDWGRGNGFRMIQAYYIYCALYFCYYYISCTSDHQPLDLGSWGAPLKGVKVEGWEKEGAGQRGGVGLESSPSLALQRALD